LSQVAPFATYEISPTNCEVGEDMSFTGHTGIKKGAYYSERSRRNRRVTLWAKSHHFDRLYARESMADN
jgi:hypothetical protein